MDLQRLGIKLYIQDFSSFEIQELISIFHTWIQNQSIEDHLLIDVHDYSHVYGGPGILLVAHEGNFSIDMSENRLGLFYYRKQPLEGSSHEQLRSILKTTLQACQLLENDQNLSGIQFKSSELLIIVNDRLQYPNTENTFDQFKPVLSKVLTHLFDSKNFTLNHRQDPQERFALVAQITKSPEIHKLLEHLS